MHPRALLGALTALQSAMDVVAYVPLSRSMFQPPAGVLRLILLKHDQATVDDLNELKGLIGGFVDGSSLSLLVDRSIRVIHAADLIDATLAEIDPATLPDRFRAALETYRALKVD